MGRTSNAKERLVAAAADLFYARGYQGVGIDHLCRRADVRKGSFYYFFRSKRELALAALDHRWRLAEEHLVEPIFRSEAPPLERIGRFFEAMGKASAREKAATGACGGCPFGNLSAEMSSHDPQIRRKVRKVFDRIAATVRSALEEAAERGEVTGIEPAAAAKALVAYLEGLLLLARTYNDPTLIAALAPGAARLLHSWKAAPARSRSSRKGGR
jgi:TetR/AcrR family transcriptional repressor of nem operon